MSCPHGARRGLMDGLRRTCRVQTLAPPADKPKTHEGGSTGLATVIACKKLYPGLLLRQGLYTRQGIKLLPPGMRLTETLVKALQRSGEPSFVLAHSVRELGSVAAVSALARESSGLRRRVAVTSGGRLAFDDSEEVEEHHRDAAGFGVFAEADAQTDRPWAIRHHELARVRATLLNVADNIVADREARWQSLPRVIQKNIEPIALPDELIAGWLDRSEIGRLKAERVQEHRRILARLVAGLPLEITTITSMIEEATQLMSRHPRRYAQLALAVDRIDDYLPDHAYTRVVLAVGMAMRLGAAHDEVIATGLAAGLADIGMAMVPKSIRDADRPLDETEINKVRRHAAWSVVMVHEIAGLPECVALAIHQHHERDDASGYPRATKATGIHEIARLIAVADEFAAATADRPHRPARRPFDVMQGLLAQVSVGTLARPMVRALLQLVGLFPVGSLVRLSDGTVATVVGSHPKMVDRPIVQRAGAGDRPGQTVDLSIIAPGDLSVLEAI